MRDKCLKYLMHAGQMLALNSNIWPPLPGTGIVMFN